jgi:lipopolysaccharide export system permease protein
MKTLDKYILGKFLGGLTGTIVAFSVIVFVVDFVERGWRMIERYDIGFDILAWYYINYMPFYVVLAFPVAVLVSTLFSMGSLAKNHELAVMKASGLSLYRITAPILIAAFVVSVGVMLFGEFVLTSCEKRKDEIKTTLMEKKTRPSKIMRTDVRVPSESGWILLAGAYNVITKEGQDVKIHKIVDNRIVKSYFAQQMVDSDSGWVLLSGSAQEFPENPAETPGHYVAFDTLWAPFLTQTPDMLAELPVPPRHMNFFDLLRRIEQKKIIGEPTSKDEVELYLKITFPFANFILALIGLPLAANPRRSGPSVGFGLSVIISFIFFVLIRTGQSLGSNGKLPPILGASLGDLVFLLIGAGMMIKARK